MPSLIASSLAMSFGSRPLFEGLSLHVEPGDRIALVGPNGAGKTTVLRVLAGALEPTDGDVQVPDHLSIALHDQRPKRTVTSVFDAVAPRALVEADSRLRELELAMADGDPATLDEYQRVRDRFERLGGDGWHAEVERVLRGLGFREEQLAQPLETLSGGELTRASLARALATRPDVLLLDEPTNHLDIAAIEWLEGFLDDLDGAVIIVSHDRWLIERACTSVIEIAHGRCRRFNGSFVEYRTQQALEAISVRREVERAHAEMAKLQRFVDTFSAGTRSRQAQSRVKALERLRQELPQHADISKRRALRFALPSPERCARVALDARGIRLVVPTTSAAMADDGTPTSPSGRVLLDGADLVIERGEKVALLGPNGAGKSTLLAALASACIADLHRPDAMRAGDIRVGYGVSARLISQHDVELVPTMSMVGNMQVVAPDLARRNAMGLLGVFGFTGDDGDRLVGALSGGERRRLLLAMALTGAANLLLIDEPTNHLDLEGREALETALTSFEGAVLLISHDRALVETVATRRVEIRDLGLHLAAPIVASTSEGVATPTPRTKSITPQQARYRRTVTRSRPDDHPRKSRRTSTRVRRPATIEQEIEQLEHRLATLASRMLDPEVYSSKQLSAQALEEHATIEREIEQRFAELERSVEHHGE